MDSYTDAQKMWIDVITAAVQQPRFDIKIGDMSYVLGNMVAKFVSSSRTYRITELALRHVISLGLDVSKPIHMKKYIYGKDKPTLLEHMIPASKIKRAIVDSDKKTGSIEHILGNAGQVVVMMRTEDEKLVRAGLRHKMPADWKGFGDDPSKRYKVADIKLTDTQIIHEGPICR